MTTLATYLFAAMTAWSPLSQHHYVEGEAVTVARYQDIASSIAAVSLDPAEQPLFAGSDGRARTAVLLAAIASFESGGFRSDVAWCSPSGLGDHGHAAGLWQSHRSKARACWSLQSAAHLALEQIRESFVACEREDPAVWLAAYASGSCSRGWVQARNRWDRAASWMKVHPWEQETDR
jgi:hypothetical protein